MAKQEHGKPKEKGLGLKLVGSPAALISKLIADEQSAEWALNQIVNEGPPHKQVQNALLFKQLLQLVTTIEQASGSQFKLQKGHTVTSKGPEHEMQLPVTLPVSSTKGIAESEELLEKIAKGPEHEILMYSMVLQILEWAKKCIKDMEKGK